MAVMEILEYPDPRLKEVAESVGEITDDVRKLLDDMAETMYNAPGIGLAATQVGAMVRVIVIDLGDDEETGEKARLHKLINPVILESAGESEMEEGCLSIPSIREMVKRPATVKVEALTPEGEKITIDADGLLATCLQHEIDHLDGILFIDRLSAVRRQLVRGKLKKLQRES